MNITSRVWFIICVLIALATAAGAATLNAKVTQVESGNTVIVSNINRAVGVRLKAIAPPEGTQPFSEAAREHLKALIFNKAVAVEYTNMSDGYLDARIYLDGIDIGSQMLRDGVAWFDRNTDYALSDSDCGFFLRCEQAARNEKRGLWSDAAPVAPWDYRKAPVARIESIPRA